MYEKMVSKRLVELRMAKGVSAREMSLDIGQNGSYINRIENEKAMPSLQGFFYICEYFGITPSEFFSSTSPSSSSALLLAKELEELEPEQIEIVRDIVAKLKKLPK